MYELIGQEMDQQDKDNFTTLSNAVDNTLKVLSTLFEEFGMHGMYKLTNPSLEDLKKVIKEMKDRIESLECDLLKKDSFESAGACIRLQNLKQGLFFAEVLLSSVERLDPDGCHQASQDIKKNGSKLGPNWD